MSLSVCVSVSLYVESIHLFIQELLTSHCCSPVAEASLFLGGVVRCVVDSLFPCGEASLFPVVKPCMVKPCMVKPGGVCLFCARSR